MKAGSNDTGGVSIGGKTMFSVKKITTVSIAATTAKIIVLFCNLFT